MTTRGLPLAERLYLHIAKGRPDECWPWTAARNRAGYGLVGVNRKSHLAHRIMYEVTHGQLLSGEAVCHSCDNPWCVNPAHLWLGSVADNNADRHRKGKSRGGVNKGTRNPMAKLTPTKVKRIVASTDTLETIAKHYGIKFQTVSDIKRGRIWSHVTGLNYVPRAER
jgi:hypothetical protein